MKPFHTITVGALIALLGGCALVGGSPPPLDTYELSSPDAEARSRRGGTQILVAEPVALKSLDGVNVVIRGSDGSIQYLSGVQWADRLPRVVQAKLAEAYQKSGAFGGVGKPGEGLAIDFQIQVEVRSFEVQVAGSGRAHVELFVKIVDDRNGVVRASRTFSANAPLSGQGNSAYVNSLDAAFNSASREIVGWTDQLI